MMKPATIIKRLSEGKVVAYKIRRLRGYLNGPAVLFFDPVEVENGVNNIQHRLDCFRFDEKPYDKSSWHVFDTMNQFEEWRKTI